MTQTRFKQGASGRPTLLVGSVPLQNAAAVFTMAAERLGDRLASIPDGETGERTNWIAWQKHAMLNATFLEEGVVEAVLGGAGRRVQFGLRSALPADAQFGRLGYAEVAKRSYDEFEALRRAGKISAETRFQVSLPTPAAPISIFIKAADAAAVEPIYARAMQDEVARILEAVPFGDLTLQWDVATEIAALEGLQPGRRPSVDEVAARLAELGGWVAPGVKLGYHFCYGDAGHKHFKEPDSTELMVRLANALFAAATRPIDYIHMPVPRSRSDDAYFAPLAQLRTPPGCTLYLGLVHHTDGLAGGKARLAAAERFVTGFGVATECGWGRRPPETIPAVMQLTAAVAVS